MRVLPMLLAGAMCVSGEVYFKETFDTASKWVQGAKDGLGVMTNEASPYYGDAAMNKGFKTSQDAKFYATSAHLDKEFNNKGKTTVVSFTVAFPQGIDCGGGYIKVLPKTEAADFNGDSDYYMMFGPDICGSTKKIHLIFGYKGKNLLWKKEPKCEDDKLTHLYTVIVNEDGTYEVQVDGEKKESGKLEEDWDFMEPKEIDDASDTKPEDWVDAAEIADPEDSKPADWDKEPEKVVDPEAEKPEDWDEEDDGEWEAPMIANPNFKGEWKQKMIPNPEYKGIWKPKRIANPDYVHDPNVHVMSKPVGTVGIDVWQVKSGTVFDNIIISDSIEEVKAFNDATWGKTHAAEAAMLKKVEEETKAAEDAAKAEAEDEAKDEDEE
eukprot:TRINITY_DN3363_c4_g2_i3.p1 TRINITY_DN3363_c4_g2~~TRINITY_DN3363_c4_g2_i3.p1  ORF type:complete len:380 (+),score=174.95 TRINITY_DN3363_c4_g2_i3:75-1214(+)